MWISTINREQFIAITQGEGLKNQLLRAAESLNEFKELDTGLVAVWSEKPEEPILPNLLLLPDHEKRDLFAWANAYLKVKPLTAFVRTLDFQVINELTTPLSNPDKWQNPIIGLILAEALTYIDQPSPKLSLRACEGTCSFAIARSLLRVEGVQAIRHAGLNWFRTREVLGNRANKLAPLHLQSVWFAIAQLVTSKTQDVSQIIVRSAKDLFELGDISDADWRALTKDIALYDLRKAMQDTREERVRLLENFLQGLGNRVRSNDDELAFLIGYLVSMIAPGTLDHWRLLTSIRQSIPTAGLWYGVCAGLRKEARMESYGGGIGRLVNRELQRKVDLLERPTCDIAVDELEITGPFFKTENGSATNAVEVEVSPGISVPFRANGSDQARLDLSSESLMQRANEPILDPEVLDNVDEALYALQEAKRSLQKVIPYSERTFFRKQRKKRPSR